MGVLTESIRRCVCWTVLQPPLMVKRRWSHTLFAASVRAVSFFLLVTLAAFVILAIDLVILPFVLCFDPTRVVYHRYAIGTVGPVYVGG